MIVGIFIPAIVVLMMVIVGTGLRAGEFGALLRAPKTLVVATLAQTLLLPVLAMALVWLLEPAPELAIGLLLVAACPGGALSNFYCHLARLDVPLSVSLTVVSSLLSFISLPLVLDLSVTGMAGNIDLNVPVGQLMRQLLLYLILPIAVGMVIRRLSGRFVQRHSGAMRAVSLTLLVALLLLIVGSQWATVQRMALESAWLALLFTGFAILFALGTAFALRLAPRTRTVLAVEFAIRNVGAAALVAAITLGRPELVAFGALFVVFQAPLILLLLFWRRARGDAHHISGDSGTAR